MSLPTHDFSNFAFRDASVVANKIVFFGSLDKKATFVLGLEGSRSERLTVEHESEAVTYARGVNNASFATLRKELFVFETNSYSKVYRFSLCHRTWTPYS